MLALRRKFLCCEWQVFTYLLIYSIHSIRYSIFIRLCQPWRHYRQSTKHGRSCLCRLPCLLLSAASSAGDSAVSQSRQRRPRHSSTPSSVAALTTVMPCYMASQIVIFSECSLCRTLLRGLLLVCGERSTSRRS